MKKQGNIFLLSKGTGSFVSEFIAYKFNQIACIHAEAYGSAEFRHGPLAMLDEDERTASKLLICAFLILCFSNLLGFGRRKLGASVGKYPSGQGERSYRNRSDKPTGHLLTRQKGKD